MILQIVLHSNHKLYGFILVVVYAIQHICFVFSKYNKFAMKNIEGGFEVAQPERQRRETTEKQSCKKGSKIIMNVSDTQYPVVKLVAKKFKWIQVNDPISSMNFDLCWTDNHVKQETFYKMNQYQRINHFPGMDILSRKNNLGRNLTSFRQKFPDQYAFFPQTWMLPGEWNELKQYHDNRQPGKAQTFIVKPEASCQGRGIFLTRQIDKLKGEKYVVQRYLHKPFLIEGLKFDMRIYVLVAGTDPMRIFVYQQGLARFATEVYMPPRSDNLENKFMHLTNYAINKNNPNFIFNQSLQQCNKGHKRSLSSVYELIREMGHDVDALKQRIDDIIIKTLITGYPTLSKVQQTVHPDNYANDMCFQILGLDVMLDSNLIPVLLEINYTPSFTTDTPLDKHIKKKLISDTLILLGINDQWKYETQRKREAEVKERLMSGRRRKYNLEERIEAVQYYAKERDRYESQNMGGFRKIFVKSQEQFQQYRKFYQFAQELYIAQNRLVGTGANYSSHYYLPFMKLHKQTKRKEKRQSSLYNYSGLHQQKKIGSVRSIDHARVASAKSTTKRVLISSTKNLQPEKKVDLPVNVYFDENEVVFNNTNLRQAFNKKSHKQKPVKQDKQ